MKSLLIAVLAFSAASLVICKESEEKKTDKRYIVNPNRVDNQDFDINTNDFAGRYGQAYGGNYGNNFVNNNPSDNPNINNIRHTVAVPITQPLSRPVPIHVPVPVDVPRPVSHYAIAIPNSVNQRHVALAPELPYQTFQVVPQGNAVRLPQQILIPVPAIPQHVYIRDSVDEGQLDAAAAIGRAHEFAYRNRAFGNGHDQPHSHIIFTTRAQSYPKN